MQHMDSLVPTVVASWIFRLLLHAADVYSPLRDRVHQQRSFGGFFFGGGANRRRRSFTSGFSMFGGGT